MRGRKTAGRSAGRLTAVMRILCLACLLVGSIGCADRVTYLTGSERMIHLKTGEAAPRDGWLVSDEHLADIYEVLGLRLPPEAPDDAPPTSPPPAE